MIFKKLVLYLVLITLFSMQVSAWTYTVDGDISDWGVIPFSDWQPDSPTANYVVEDYGDGADRPWGGEEWDIEALYFDNDNNYAYFAIITSHSEYHSITTMGDLALDIDNNGNYEYGIKVTGQDKGQICYMPKWKKIWWWSRGPSTFTCDDINSQIMPGTAVVMWKNASLDDNGYPNYIVEIQASVLDLGNPTDQQLSNAHTSMSCLNDHIELEPFTWDFDVPEFSTLGAIIALFCIGLFISKKRTN